MRTNLAAYLLNVIPPHPEPSAVLHGWQCPAMNAAHDPRPGDAEQLGDLANRELLRDVVGSVVDPLVLLSRLRWQRISRKAAALRQRLDLT